MMHAWVIILVVGVANAWQMHRSGVRRQIGASIVGAALVGLGTQSAWSAEDMLEMSSTPTNVIAVTVSSPSSADDEARIQRKLAKQKEMNGGSVNDGSYLSSFKKEQAKQKAQTKTKAQKAKDMCESLGRGC